MKILVSGCSLSVGYGFASSRNDSKIWPNLLGKHLNAEVTNVSIPGYDNPGIFLNAINKFSKTDYDLILIQVTSLNRLVVSPNMHSKINLMAPVDLNLWKGRIDKKDYDTFCKNLVWLNRNFEHWNRLANIIITVQNLVEQGYNIKFVNGLLNWDQSFFQNTSSKFSDQILDVDELPDEDIQQGLDIINQDKQEINLDLWINPFEPLFKLKVDNASSTDIHPGVNSQKIFSDLIVNYLQQNNERKHHG
jgi:hypothetical protein